MTTETSQPTKQMIFSYSRNKKEQAEKAYKVTTAAGLIQLNRIFNTSESIYPAIYVDMFGMVTLSDIGQEQFLENIGYVIIQL